MTIDTAIIQESADVSLDATAPSTGGKRRLLFLRNRKARDHMPPCATRHNDEFF